MSIKNDKWIRQQCIAPSHVVTEAIMQVASHPMMALLPKNTERFTHETAEQITKRQAKKGYPTVISYRPLTEAEINGYVPMISPFESKQVRVKERPANLVERELWLAGRKAPFNTSLTPLGAHLADGSREDVVIDEKIVSYGTSSFGYDVRLGDEFKIFTNINSTMIDPLNFDHSTYVDQKGPFCIIPPNSYILGMTIERFVIPRDVMVICLGKSTYARCGAIVNVTPIEAGFEGNVVIEISNATNLPMKVYAGQGIAQFLFFQSDEACEVSYADRGGKYQGQSGITVAKV